jgi:Tol biopolymer transport system component
MTGNIVASLDKLRVRALSAKDPVLSPDGQMIACSVGEPACESLCLIRLADLVANNPQPRPVAQGRMILPDAVTTFIGTNVSCGSPAWSPDGRQLAFGRLLMTTEGIQGDVFVVNADGSGLRQLTRVGPNQVATQPCFSPDGKRVAFTVATGKLGAFKVEHLLLMQFKADIFSVGVDGGGVRQLTNDGMSSEPAWGL